MLQDLPSTYCGALAQGVEEEGSRGDHDTQGWDGEGLTGSADSSDELRGHSIHANGPQRTSNRQLRTSGRGRTRRQHNRRLSTDATRVWGNRAAAAAADVREASQRQNKLTMEQAFRVSDTSEGTRVYGTAYAVLWQSSDDVSDPKLHLVDPYRGYVSGECVKIPAVLVTVVLKVQFRGSMKESSTSCTSGASECIQVEDDGTTRHLGDFEINIPRYPNAACLDLPFRNAPWLSCRHPLIMIKSERKIR